VKISKLPIDEKIFEMFSVTANGEDVPIAAARVSALNYNRGWPGHQRQIEQSEIAGFLRIQSNETVNFCVTVKEKIEDVCIRPLSKKIKIEHSGDSLLFSIKEFGQYTLEINGFHNALHIFISPESEKPKLTENDIYYGPGVHKIGIVELHSNQNVYIDSDAVVYGGFVAFSAENINIGGFGVLDGSYEERTNDTRIIINSKNVPYDYFLNEENIRNNLKENNVLNGCIRFYGCKDCTISQITCRDVSTFAIIPAVCENIIFDDVKLIGNWKYNSDGIDLINSKNCIIKNSFLRNFDDCVVLKGINGFGNKSLENIITENCVIWCDWGRGLEIGAETVAKEFKNIVFRNCDIIHGSWLHLDIQHHNFAYIHDVIFEDIRCEYTKYQQAMKFQDYDDQCYSEAKTVFDYPGLLGAFFLNTGFFGDGHSGQNIENIAFKNIKIISDENLPIPICGFEGLDDENQVKNVIIENLTLNGKKLNIDLVNLKCNEFTNNIIIK